jgi:nicotinamidase-related amidase
MRRAASSSRPIENALLWLAFLRRLASLFRCCPPKEGFEVFVVGDTCGGLTSAGHELALRRMETAGAQVTSWIQVLLEFQRDWTRHDTYEAARAIVVANGGGYGIGLAYAREMIHTG